jgi:hypothetical protein
MSFKNAARAATILVPVVLGAAGGVGAFETGKLSVSGDPQPLTGLLGFASAFAIGFSIRLPRPSPPTAPAPKFVDAALD